MLAAGDRPGKSISSRSLVALVSTSLSRRAGTRKGAMTLSGLSDMSRSNPFAKPRYFLSVMFLRNSSLCYLGV